jgi:hypothetical protein
MAGLVTVFRREDNAADLSGNYFINCRVLGFFCRLWGLTG